MTAPIFLIQGNTRGHRPRLQLFLPRTAFFLFRSAFLLRYFSAGLPGLRQPDRDCLFAAADSLSTLAALQLSFLTFVHGALHFLLRLLTVSGHCDTPS